MKMNKIQKCELCDNSVSFPMDNIQGGAPVCAVCKEKYLHERPEQHLQEVSEALENQKAGEKSVMERVIIGLLQALLVMLVAGIAGFLAGALSGCSSLPQEPDVVTTTMCGIKVSVPVPEFSPDRRTEWRSDICEYFEVLVENEDWETLHRKLRLMRCDSELYAAYTTLIDYQNMVSLREEKTLRKWAEFNINKRGCTQARVDTMVLWVYLQSKEFHRCLVYYDKLSVKTEADELIAYVARARLGM